MNELTREQQIANAAHAAARAAARAAHAADDAAEEVRGQNE